MMKFAGRIAALFIAAVISVLTVQRVIKKLYSKLDGRYITLPSDTDSAGRD